MAGTVLVFWLSPFLYFYKVLETLAWACGSSALPSPPTPQVNNINQPLEITAISSPESSLKSSPTPYQDHDQPPVLRKERPLGPTNGAHYSPLTSDEEPGSEDEPSSAR